MIDQKESKPINYIKNPIRGGNGTPALTLSQAFRWFREKHEISGEISVFYGAKVSYGWIITRSNTPDYYSVLDISTYEEAEIACLDKLIEIVENK
jgi:hypothetical protein